MIFNHFLLIKYISYIFVVYSFYNLKIYSYNFCVPTTFLPVHLRLMVLYKITHNLKWSGCACGGGGCSFCCLDNRRAIYFCVDGGVSVCVYVFIVYNK